MFQPGFEVDSYRILNQSIGFSISNNFMEFRSENMS
jgi:hypothetical protein